MAARPPCAGLFRFIGNGVRVANYFIILNKTAQNHKNLPHNITLPVPPVHTHQDQNSYID